MRADAVEVRGSLPRRLLALLALTLGREVDTDRLVDGLWGDDPPAAASATLHSHVARLRRDLTAPDVIRTGRHGYALDIEPEGVDAFASNVTCRGAPPRCSRVATTRRAELLG